MLKKIIPMLDYIDSRVMAFTQKVNNHMEEWFDWWDRFFVAKIFAALSCFSWTGSHILMELSEKDRSWSIIVMAILLWLMIFSFLMKYSGYRKTASLQEEASDSIRISIVDMNAIFMRRSLLLSIVFFLILPFVLQPRSSEYNLEYLWAFNLGIALQPVCYFFACASLYLSGINNGKRKQRLKKLVREIVDKVTAAVSPAPVPSLQAQPISFDQD